MSASGITSLRLLSAAKTRAQVKSCRIDDFADRADAQRAADPALHFAELVRRPTPAKVSRNAQRDKFASAVI